MAQRKVSLNVAGLIPGALGGSLECLGQWATTGDGEVFDATGCKLYRSRQDGWVALVDGEWIPVRPAPFNEKACLYTLD